MNVWELLSLMKLKRPKWYAEYLAEMEKLKARPDVSFADTMACMQKYAGEFETYLQDRNYP